MIQIDKMLRDFRTKIVKTTHSAEKKPRPYKTGNVQMSHSHLVTEKGLECEILTFDSF